MKYKTKILMLFSLIMSTYAMSQITLNACHPLLEDQDYIFNNIDTDATGRNIFETNPIDGNQPCGGIGSCEFQIAWNNANNRWEIYADDGNGTFSNKFVLYYSNKNTLPNPPSTLSTWEEETGVTQSLCGAILLLEGDVQDPDTEKPDLSGVPTEPIISDSDPGFCGASIDFPVFTATDNSPGEISIISDPLSGSFFDVGTTPVTVTATDLSGNSTTESFEVIVDDNIAPVPDLAVLPDLEGQKSIDMPAGYTATDNCTGAITATTNTKFPIKNKGLTIITWIYDDGNGNTTIQTQDAIVNKVNSNAIKVKHFPNPFKESITFSFEIPYGANFKIAIYGQLGNLVSELTIGDYMDNTYNVIWNANSFNDGVYFYKLLTNGLEVGKGTIIKNAHSGK